MRVSEYRQLIEDVGYWRNDLLTAATSHEQRLAAMRLRDAAAKLQQAKCRTARLTDRQRAARVLTAAEQTLTEKQSQFDRADCNLIRMAFSGSGW